MNISTCLPTKWMVNTLLATLTCSLQPRSWTRWAEARDPLLPKTTKTGVSNVNWSQTSGNLFSSRKLKGHHTFTTQSAIVESTEAEEDLSVKPEREEEAES